MATNFDTTVTTTHSGAAGTVTQSRVVTTEAAPLRVRVSLTSSQANKRERIAIPDLSRLKSLIITSPVDVDIFTNAPSGGSPDQTLEIAAAAGLTWDVGSGATCPLTDPTTDWYFTNQEAVAVPLNSGAPVIEIMLTFNP